MKKKSKKQFVKKRITNKNTKKKRQKKILGGSDIEYKRNIIKIPDEIYPLESFDDFLKKKNININELELIKKKNEELQTEEKTIRDNIEVKNKLLETEMAGEMNEEKTILIQNIEDEIKELKNNEKECKKKIDDNYFMIKILSKRIEENDKTHIMFILGLGCDRNMMTDIDKYNAKNKYYAKEYKCKKFEWKCHPSAFDPFNGIITSTLGIKPLRRNAYIFQLINEIFINAKYNTVFIVGHSFGGLIVNRIAEELIELYDFLLNLGTEPKNLENLENLKKIFEKIHIAGFGSIYISENMKNNELFKSFNYISVGDVANTCTRGICHKQTLDPMIFKYGMNHFKYQLKYYHHYNDTEYDHSNDRIKLDYKMRRKEKIYDICLYNGDEPSCQNFINNIPIIRAFNEWEIHNNYYNFIRVLLKNRTLDIENLVLKYKTDPVNYNSIGSLID